jgi:hypothetical protein
MDLALRDKILGNSCLILLDTVFELIPGYCRAISAMILTRLHIDDGYLVPAGATDSIYFVNPIY